MAEAEICLVDSGTTNTILRETRYFQTLTNKSGNIMTIARSNAHIVGSKCHTGSPHGCRNLSEGCIVVS
jgi:hypothetical protein